MMDDSLRVSILSEALPYIQNFSGRKIVVKYGGSIMEDEKLKEAFFRDIALLSSVGVCPVVIPVSYTHLTLPTNREV